MKRREFITLLGGATALPFAAHSQSSVPLIGYLASSSAAAPSGPIEAVHLALKQSGYEVGQASIISQVAETAPRAADLSVHNCPDRLANAALFKTYGAIHLPTVEVVLMYDRRHALCGSSTRLAVSEQLK